MDTTIVDGDIVNPWDLVSTKYYIRYWRYFASKKCNLILELVVLKLLDKKKDQRQLWSLQANYHMDSIFYNTL